MFLRFTLIAVLVLAVSMVSGASAWAHPAPEVAEDLPAAMAPLSTMAWSSAPESPAVPWSVMLGAVAALAIAWRRPRRALALAIVLILGLFAFENGVHSVHHLDDLRHLNDLRAGATCSVAAATAHLAGTPVEGTTQAHLVLTSPEPVVVQQPLSLETSCLAAHQGRAPPISA